MGKGELESVKKVFSMSMTTHITISLLIFFLAETIGLWFINTQLNIPANRMLAANWVYQFSILTFIVNLIRIPYNASIIAYENMSFYAYISKMCIRDRSSLWQSKENRDCENLVPGIFIIINILCNMQIYCLLVI